jgi:hypothetical protein
MSSARAVWALLSPDPPVLLATLVLLAADRSLAGGEPKRGARRGSFWAGWGQLRPSWRGHRGVLAQVWAEWPPSIVLVGDRTRSAERCDRAQALERGEELCLPGPSARQPSV